MKKILSFLLALTLLVGVLVPGTLAIRARAEDGETQDPSKGMVIDKTATKVDDNTFQITLEAYATGTKVISQVKKDVPTDIILVLDQSGSMGNDFTTVTEDTLVSYGPRKNSDNYNDRTNNDSSSATKNLWYRLADGSYVDVSVEREQKSTYTYSAFTGRNSQAYNNRNALYFKEGEEYRQVSVTYNSGGNYNRTYTYTYTDGDGKTQTLISQGQNGQAPTGLYTRQQSQYYEYTYSYTIDGAKTVIATSTGQDTVCQTAFYKKITSGNSITRLESLKIAVASFVDAVREKAAGPDGNIATTADNINHRIAMVGFASGAGDNNYTLYYGNTELFIGSNEYNYNNVNQSTDSQTLASGMYGQAFQDMSTETGYNNIIDSQNMLAADGATQIDYGIDMANGIFNANPIPQNETRNRVMIVFTDGHPSKYSNYSEDVATAANSNATIAKNTHKATVYTVGIFDGANATSAGDKDGSNAERSNWLLQNISSNNGTPSTSGSPSYYLSAGDSVSLNSIFQQIAQNIESGGSSTELGESTVIKDIIAPQFQLPAGATASNITLETYACTGKDVSGKCTFSTTKNATTMGATATVNATNGTVDVTGFDFAENWCGTETVNDNATSRGHKLVIKFNVKTREGFLGGNDVYTNTSAGVYENADATEPVLTFPRPQVNVPIKPVTVTPEGKNVYLLGDITAEQIKSGTTVSCGSVELKLNETNYGLEAWQTEYVDIEVTYTDASGNALTDLNDLQADTTYNVSVTVKPKTATPTSTEGTVATAQTGNGTGNIYVFTPELTYKDSQVWYGDTAPADYSVNLTNTEWKHNGTVADTAKMGAAPILNLTYDPGAGVVDGKVAVKSDIPVDVTVQIDQTDVTDKTFFVHTKCNDNETAPTDGKFWLHVNTCSLTITKAAATGTTIGNDEYFVFTVKKDNAPYTQVTIKGTGSVTISELPVGTYTIEEDTSVAWRYGEPAYSGSGALSSTNHSGNLICTNTKTTDNWLNHFSRVINTYGSKTGTQG